MKVRWKPVRMAWLTNAPKLIICGSDFRLGNYLAPGMPVVRDGHLRVDTNVSAYFRHLCRKRGGSPGTMKEAAYILRDWMAYLRSRRLFWAEVTDDVVAGWCLAQRDAGAFRGHKDALGAKRLTGKVSRVYDFYYVAEHELGLVSGLIEKANVPQVEQPDRGLTIGEVFGKRRRKSWEPGYKVPGKHPGNGKGRPTPDAEAVEKVQLAGLDRPSAFAAATNGLILDLMSRAAPRASGVAGMTVDGFSEALAAENILDRRGPTPVAWRLAEIAGNYGARRSVIASVETLAASARSSLFVLVVEKGGKERQLEVPHELFTQILSYIWDQRADLLTQVLCGKPVRDTGALWLSIKTRRALTAGAIGNMAKAAFNVAGIAGSGHRLRAYAVENKLVDNLRKGRARAGRNHSIHDATFATAQFAGHSDSRSLVYYANKFRRRENEIDQFVVGVSDKDVANQIRAIAKRIEDGDEGARQALSEMMRGLGLQPLAEVGTREDARSRDACALNAESSVSHNQGRPSKKSSH